MICSPPFVFPPQMAFKLNSMQPGLGKTLCADCFQAEFPKQIEIDLLDLKCNAISNDECFSCLIAPKWISFTLHTGPPGQIWTQQFLWLFSTFTRLSGSCRTLILSNWIGPPLHLFLSYSSGLWLCVFHHPGGCQQQHFGDQAGGWVDRHRSHHITGRGPFQTGSAGQVWVLIVSSHASYSVDLLKEATVKNYISSSKLMD